MSKPEHITLTELQYSTDTRGALRLYLFNRDGFHRVGQFFARKIRYPEKEMPWESAREAAEAWIKLGLECRVTNGGDFLVFHSRDGKVLYPESAEDFWERAGR